MATIVEETKASVPAGMTAVDATSGKGNPIQFGIPKGTEDVLRQKQSEIEARKNDGLLRASAPVKLDWKTGRGWQDTTPEVYRDTGIRRWKIEDDGFFFKYRLVIYADRHQSYTFYDETSDHYDLMVLVENTDHYVDYNSDKPTMVSVVLN